MQKSRRQNGEKVKTIVYYRFITHHYSYGGNYMFTIENFIHGIAYRYVASGLEPDRCNESDLRIFYLPMRGSVDGA